MRKSRLVLVASALVVLIMVPAIAYFTQPSASSPGPGLEPSTLKELVEFDDPLVGRTATLNDVPQPEVPIVLDDMLLDPEFGESFDQVMLELERKGYMFEPPEITAHISYVDVKVEDYAYTGRLLSWWSMEGPYGTRALLTGALMMDLFTGEMSSMAFGVMTNLLSPEHYPETDPYIIVNAMPYIYVEYVWWWYYPWPRLNHWKYWWYDSHSHPNWYWGPYWWWRVYIRRYAYDVWYPWYWYHWHWLYWRHWYWWSSYFPW